MFDPFESRFDREFAKLITLARAEKTGFLASGRAETIEAYREAVGYIRALDKITELAAELRKELYGSRDDG
jgi:aspartate/tyrosine/aromatic aminotransferase